MNKEVGFLTNGSCLCALLPSEIDHHVAKRVRESIDGRLRQTRPEVLVLDFSEVTFMDSSGIGLIMGRAGLCEELFCRVRLSGLTERQRKLVKLSGVEKIRNLTIDRKGKEDEKKNK